MRKNTNDSCPYCGLPPLRSHSKMRRGEYAVSRRIHAAMGHARRPRAAFPAPHLRQHGCTVEGELSHLHAGASRHGEGTALPRAILATWPGGRFPPCGTAGGIFRRRHSRRQGTADAHRFSQRASQQHVVRLEGRQNPDGNMLVKKLIPHIDVTFRTPAAREGRIIEGFSVGGYGAARLGLKYHEASARGELDQPRDTDQAPAGLEPAAVSAPVGGGASLL